MTWNLTVQLRPSAYGHYLVATKDRHFAKFNMEVAHYWYDAFWSIGAQPGVIFPEYWRELPDPPRKFADEEVESALDNYLQEASDKLGIQVIKLTTED